ncbi:acylcarnitine hydrolase-like [Cydia pomonella]|uniref:acylcarnitine hydrolase-like n=1 Tax=Cydia pomonella TaxID=82600 RepID=UPI002ADE4793|nr:acylcarnitine hydrolase-like [Cydia pomonella]
MLRFIIICFLITTVLGKNEKKVVILDEGGVEGEKYWNGEFFEFYGVPYASVPKGRDRFQAPLPPEPWGGVMPAKVRSTRCFQTYLTGGDEEPIFDGEEQCLVVNLLVPTIATDDNLVPVVVYIHSGAFSGGNGNMAQFHYLARQDVLVISFNFRLGVLGFACLGNKQIPGNAGLKDTVAALRWINKNIAKFGGDPKKVTIAGFSVGAAMAELVALSDTTDGLIDKLILESGSALSPFAINRDPVNTARNMAIAVGYKDTGSLRDLTEFYLETPIKNLTATGHNFFLPNSTFGFSPCIENVHDGIESFLTEPPLDIMKEGKSKQLAVLTGFSNMEGLSRSIKFDEWSEKMNDKFDDFLPADLVLKSQASGIHSVSSSGKEKTSNRRRKTSGAEDGRSTQDWSSQRSPTEDRSSQRSPTEDWSSQRSPTEERSPKGSLRRQKPYGGLKQPAELPAELHRKSQASGIHSVSSSGKEKTSNRRRKTSGAEDGRSTQDWSSQRSPTEDRSSQRSPTEDWSSQRSPTEERSPKGSLRRQKPYGVFNDNKLKESFIKEIKDKYFKGEEVSHDTLQGYVDYFSDSMFKYSILKSAKLHAERTERPLFLYEFSYVGDLNAKHFFWDKITGASHRDQTAYILDFYGFTNKNSDLTTRDRMTMMWADFVKYENPTAYESQLIEIKWKTYTNDDRNYLKIDTELVIDKNLFEDGFNFWEKVYDKHYWNPKAPEIIIEEPKPLKRTEDEINDDTAIPNAYKSSEKTIDKTLLRKPVKYDPKVSDNEQESSTPNDDSVPNTEEPVLETKNSKTEL